MKLAETRSEVGIRSARRPFKSFVNWVWDEYDFDGRPPTNKVKSDPGIPLPGVPIAVGRKMLEVCYKRMRISDCAILTRLLDIGARVSEFLALNWGDVELTTGIARIRHGKDDKPRNVFLGRHSRKMLRKWNQESNHTKANDPIWITESGTRLKYSGFSQIIRRRAEETGIDMPGIHDFRRTATSEMLGNGANPISVSRIDGHNNLKTTISYLNQTVDNLYEVHERSSPVNNMDGNMPPRKYASNIKSGRDY